jgi:hypothetical protein
MNIKCYIYGLFCTVLNIELNVCLKEMSADDLASCGFVYSWHKVPCHVLSDADSVLRSLICTFSP